MGDAETTSGLLLGPAFGKTTQTTLPRKGLSLNPFSRAKQLQKLDGQGIKAPAGKGILRVFIYHDIHVFPVTKRVVPTNLVSDYGQGIEAPTAKGILKVCTYHNIHIFPVTKRVVPMNLVSDLGTVDQFPPKMSPFYEMIVESMEDTRILHESAGLTVDGKPIQGPAA